MLNIRRNFKLLLFCLVFFVTFLLNNNVFAVTTKFNLIELSWGENDVSVSHSIDNNKSQATSIQLPNGSLRQFDRNSITNEQCVYLYHVVGGNIYGLFPFSNKCSTSIKFAGLNNLSQQSEGVVNINVNASLPELQKCSSEQSSSIGLTDDDEFCYYCSGHQCIGNIKLDSLVYKIGIIYKEANTKMQTFIGDNGSNDGHTDELVITNDGNIISTTEYIVGANKEKAIVFEVPLYQSGKTTYLNKYGDGTIAGAGIIEINSPSYPETGKITKFPSNVQYSSNMQPETNHTLNPLVNYLEHNDKYLRVDAEYLDEKYPDYFPYYDKYSGAGHDYLSYPYMVFECLYKFCTGNIEWTKEDIGFFGSKNFALSFQKNKDLSTLIIDGQEHQLLPAKSIDINYKWIKKVMYVPAYGLTSSTIFFVLDLEQNRDDISIQAVDASGQTVLDISANPPEKPQDGEGNYDEGELQKRCDIIPPVIRKWINNILNFVKYVALVLVITLGALDFVQAAGTGEPDSMKKAGQKFVKRLIAVVVLFLVPVLVDLILNMINIYGVDPNNPTCL